MCPVNFHIRLGEKGVRESLPTTLLSYCQQVATGMAFLVERGCVVSTLATKYILVSEEDICKVIPIVNHFKSHYILGLIGGWASLASSGYWVRGYMEN